MFWNWAWPSDLLFDEINSCDGSEEVNRYGLVTTVRSSLECQDRATWSREERASRDLVCPIVNRHFTFSYGALNLSHYNSSDEQPRFMFFNKMNHCPFKCCHLPPSLIWKWGAEIKSHWFASIGQFWACHVTCEDIKRKIVTHDKNKRNWIGIWVKCI